MIKYTCTKCGIDKEAKFINDGYIPDPFSNGKMCEDCFGIEELKSWENLPWYKRLWYIITK